MEDPAQSEAVRSPSPTFSFTAWAWLRLTASEEMSYIRLHDQTPQTRTQYPPSLPSNSPPSNPRSLLMRLPQYGPRDLKGGKVSRERKRKLLLSYLPDWSVTPSVCIDPSHTDSI